jgi:hypothetical protein
MNGQSILRAAVVALLTGAVALTAPVASGQRPSPPREGRNIHRDNERVTVEGRIRSIHRERDGYRVELDRNDDSFWVPERTLRNRSRDFRIGVSLRFGGVFRNGMIAVDVVDWPPYVRPPERHREADVLRGFVERVRTRHAALRVREERSGRMIDVSLLRPYDLDAVRPGDFIILSGEWRDRDQFDARRVEAVRPRR